MTEEVVGCQHCGSRRVVPKVLVGGPMAGLDNKDGTYICLDCGRELVPLGFEGEEERKDFAAQAQGTGKGFLHIPIVPVDTWSLFNLPILDMPIVQVAKVVELEWRDGWEILPGGVPFADYWKAVGSKRYGAEDVLLMDLAGMQHARPNFDALKALMKRRYSVWLEMGVRDVHDIFDAFTLGSQNVLLGSLTCPSERMLEDVIELSDMSVPLLYYDGRVLWSGKRMPGDLSRSLKLLEDMGFERAAVLDLRRLGGRDGYDSELADRALSSGMDILFGGGVRETDLPGLREKGAVGGLLDPYTPVLRDLISSQVEPDDEEPLPSPLRRESPRGLGVDG
ncbi:MAG: hypothetical protein GXY70_06445 [Euryarchaeota archaeon]|nr:hypothetical protein [Euryarchaeota archaeon]